MSSVLDASALLAYLLSEGGADRVQQALEDDAFISSVNLTEVVTRLVDQGVSEELIRSRLALLNMEVVPLDEELAYRAGLLRAATRAAGLSLGDRACLALAESLSLPAMTADRAWASLQLDAQFSIQVDVIR